MIKKEINNHNLEIHGYDEHESIRHLINKWENHPNEFEDIRIAVKNDMNQKLYLGDIVAEYRGGRYIIRKSTESY